PLLNRALLGAARWILLLLLGLGQLVGSWRFVLLARLARLGCFLLRVVLGRLVLSRVILFWGCILLLLLFGEALERQLKVPFGLDVAWIGAERALVRIDRFLVALHPIERVAHVIESARFESGVARLGCAQELLLRFVEAAETVEGRPSIETHAWFVLQRLGRL